MDARYLGAEGSVFWVSSIGFRESDFRLTAECEMDLLIINFEKLQKSLALVQDSLSRLEMELETDVSP